MALNNNGNGNNRDYNPTVYSKIFLNNRDSDTDKTRLEFSYWNSMLKIAIVPYIPGSDEIDRKSGIALHLSVPKAYQLLKEIEAFEEDQKLGVNTNFFYGVNTPKGLIGIGTGEQLGNPNAVLFTIRRIDETGETISSYAYQIKQDGYYYGVRNFDPTLKTFERSYYDNLEIDMIKKHLSNYVDSMTMAAGYGALEAFKSPNDQTYKSLNAIKSKLGIKVETKQYGAGSFFRDGERLNNTPPKSSYSSITDAINPEGDQPVEELDPEDVPF